MKNQELWKKLKCFTIGVSSAKLSFVKRLARENGWTLEYSQNVYSEYLKFLYLLSISSSICTPSDEVDQVWHLHLAYSESYWNDLCKNLIGHPIHHGPTKGGEEESSKYRLAYKHTLQLYEHEFGTKPPVNIWPPTERRFRNAGSFLRINTSSVFIIPIRKAILFSLALATLIAMSAARAESSFAEGVLISIVLVIGIPIIILLLLWIADHSKKDGKGGKGEKGGGCGGCAGCGGCGS